jgi:glutamate N-acetyltransferase/amino-acid N-acetyltransferase
MKSICAVKGVEAAGIKEGKYGLALIRAEGSAAGVFTSNLVRAPCIERMEEKIRSGRLNAIIANSGCANAFTGEKGRLDTDRMCAIAGDVLGMDPEYIGVASTGVIGRFLNLSLIERQAKAIAPRLERSEEAEEAAAQAIMTTDLVAKHALVEGDSFRVGGICKGSGMIAPSMGTMLAFLYTDARIGAANLQQILRRVAHRTFNRVVVDGDMSTNDIALCTATGEAGPVREADLERALEVCCRSLAMQIASDGEGATKLIEVRVRGAPGEEQAANVARTIVASPLVKTAVYGIDPNWGRVVAAAGRAGVPFDPYHISLFIGEGPDQVPLVRNGTIVVDLAQAKKAMGGNRVVFVLDLQEGPGEATAWGCDLTEEYVHINGRYTT